MQKKIKWVEDNKLEQLNEDQYIKVQEEIVQQKIDRPVNLKIGDIVYFKNYVDKRKNGIISGDGIASNKLECIPQMRIVNEEEEDPLFQDEINENSQENKLLIQKNSQLMFRKCLF